MVLLIPNNPILVILCEFIFKVPVIVDPALDTYVELADVISNFKALLLSTYNLLGISVLETAIYDDVIALEPVFITWLNVVFGIGEELYDIPVVLSVNEVILDVFVLILDVCVLIFLFASVKFESKAYVFVSTPPLASKYPE